MTQKQLLFFFVVGLALATLVPHPKGAIVFKPAQKNPHRMELHGDVRIDDYFWMRERDTPPVLEYLRQENKRTAMALAPVKDLEQKLYWEMRARIKEDDASVPLFDTGYWYYWRFEKGHEYPLHCRKKGDLNAPEELILNENTIAQGHTYFQVATSDTSPDQNILAYAVDTRGRRIYDIYFKDLRTGQLLNDKIEAVTANFTWAKDSKTIFFTQQDAETLRHDRVFRYELGSGKPPELVFEEKDTTFNVGVEGSKTHRWVFLASEKRDSSEVWFLDSSQPHGRFQVIQPREEKHEYGVVDGGDRFFILTNWNAKNFRLMEADYNQPGKGHWRELVAHNPKVLLESVDVYQDFLALSERENGLTQISVRQRGDGKSYLLKFPDPVFEVDVQPLPDYFSKAVRFHYESLVQPPSVMEEVVATQKREIKKTREVPGYKPGLYESRRLWAKAKDGALIPISLFMRKDRPLNGGPALLYGYGSYGLSMDASFRSSMLSLVDRGFVYAIAHIRGGSEMGREWYENGRLKNKMNTFTDFIAAAEKLNAERYTSPEHLHIMGGSAGGLLMGAVMNLRPDLFKSVNAGVPFVDVMTTMLDESIPLTTGEYNEWGDPRLREQYGWMRAYSPYDNVERKAYPHLLVTTGYHDSQVQYWEPAKWVAKLRDYKTDDHLLLLYTELDAGHSGASGRFEALKTLAKELGFILMLEGIKD